MQIISLLIAAFIGVASATAVAEPIAAPVSEPINFSGARSCRQCDCVLKWTRAEDKPRTQRTTKQQAQTTANGWVNKFVARGAFDAFQLDTTPDTVCPPNDSETCDFYQASFKAWRLCGNGGGFDCTQKNGGGTYSTSCACTNSVKCRGDCQEGCPNLV